MLLLVDYIYPFFFYKKYFKFGDWTNHKVRNDFTSVSRWICGPWIPQLCNQYFKKCSVLSIKFQPER